MNISFETIGWYYQSNYEYAFQYCKNNLSREFNCLTVIYLFIFSWHHSEIVLPCDRPCLWNKEETIKYYKLKMQYILLLSGFFPHCSVVFFFLRLTTSYRFRLLRHHYLILKGTFHWPKLQQILQREKYFLTISWNDHLNIVFLHRDIIQRM